MCSSGKAPKPQPQLPQAPVAPSADLSGGTGTGVNDRRRASAAAGGTILTSSRGVTESGATSTKTLLGS